MKKLARLLIILFIIAVPASRAEMHAQGQSTEVYYFFPVVDNAFYVPLSYQTNILDITAFLEKCPNNDPAYSKLRQDFVIRMDGVVIADIPCTEPISAMPIADYTNALIAVQAFRVAYYMDPGITGFLPWTSMNLYDWMASNVGGVNLKSAPGQLYCCDDIDGRKYISQSIQDEFNRDYKRTWLGLYSTVAYFAHEIRHADGGPDHVTGCAAFPNPGDPPGCDTGYDLNNLGSYGVQYWLNQSWLTGTLNIGISCAADDGLAYAVNHQNSLNGARDRFVTNIPPLVDLPAQPYGGVCHAP